jgi:hypothetical protein
VQTALKASFAASQSLTVRAIDLVSLGNADSMTTSPDPSRLNPNQDPAPDSEIDFDDEADEEFPEPDERENEEIGADLDDPES